MCGTPNAVVQSESSTGRTPVLKSACLLLGIFVLLASHADAQEPPIRRAQGSAETKSSRHQFGIIGEVVRPGVYEYPEEQPLLVDLVRQARGMVRTASGSIQIIRDGRPGPKMHYSPGLQHALEPGDLLVVEAASNVVRDPSALQVALVNLIDRPVVLKIRQEDATLSQILRRLNQRPELSLNVRIIGPGGHFESGPPTALARMPLASGTVLVFDRSLVDADLIPALDRTYPVDRDVETSNHSATHSVPDGPVISPAVRQNPRPSEPAAEESIPQHWPIVRNDRSLMSQEATHETPVAADNGSATATLDYETFEPNIAPTIEPAVARSSILAAEMLAPPQLEAHLQPVWEKRPIRDDRSMPADVEPQAGMPSFEDYPQLSYSEPHADTPDESGDPIKPADTQKPELLLGFDIDELPAVESESKTGGLVLRGLALAGIAILVAGVWRRLRQSAARRRQSIPAVDAESSSLGEPEAIHACETDELLDEGSPLEQSHGELSGKQPFVHTDAEQPMQESFGSAPVLPSGSPEKPAAEEPGLPEPRPLVPPAVAKVRASDGKVRVDARQVRFGDAVCPDRAESSSRETVSQPAGPLERALSAMHSERTRESHRPSR